ncbi:MAG TPA: PAS domain-containing protein [Ohtaekwangia sp.]|nr:PAS domain-containing protein [Ohtaekwangia sp.]
MAYPTQDKKIIQLQLQLADKIGKSFFDAVAIGLNNLVDGDFTFIAAFDNQKIEAKTLSICDREGLLDNFKYPISDTPTEIVDKSGTYVYPHGVHERFPENVILKEFDIEGYVAVAIRDAAKNPIGSVAVLFKKKIEHPEFIKTTVEVLSVRIKAEMERLSAERILREQQERYEFALDAGGFGLYDWNTYTDEVVFDKRFYEIIGHTPETLKPSYANWVGLVHADDYEELAVGITRRIANGKEYYGPSKLRIRDARGNYKWVQLESYSFYYDPEKKAKRNIGIIKDIDRQVNNENQLREAAKHREMLHKQIKEREERYDFALKVGELGVYDWYVKEKRTIFSPILAEMLGRNPEEFNTSFEGWLKTVHPEDRERLNWNSQEPEIHVHPIVYRLANKKGEFRWVEAHSMAIETDKDGNTVRMIGILKDIDESKRSADLLIESLEKLKQLNIELVNRENELTESQAKLIANMSALQMLNKELKESETRWAYALEGNGDGVIEWDMAHDRVFFSKRAKAILGFALETQEDRNGFLNNIHPESRDLFKHYFYISIHPPYDPFQMEVQIIDDHKQLRWIMFRGKVVETDESNKPMKMVGTVTDLSQHKLFQKELTIYEEMIKQNQSMILFTTREGVIEFVNNTTLSLLEYPMHAMIGQNISKLLPDVEIDQLLSGDHRHKLTFKSRSGKKIVSQVAFSRLVHEGDEIGYVVNGIDITEKAILEEKVTTLTVAKLKSELEAQRNQTAMTIQVQENEKQSIARELHDGVGQLLSLAKLQVDQFGDEFPGEHLGSKKNLREIIQQISSDIKGITRDLMPLSIRNLGLESGLTSLLERYNIVKEHRIKFLCKVHLDGYEPDEKTAIHIFRIAQEAINNSIKYSQATALSLMCLKLKNTLNLVVEDNGIGFDYTQQITKQNSFGLKTMNERARLIHGKLLITSAAKSGTTISLTIPLIENNDKNSRCR